VSLRQQIENLIQADAAAGGFLALSREEGGPQETQSYASSAADDSEPALDKELDANTEKLGDSIGPYKLLQRIGEGGMGVVYMADQDKPVRRRVVLKVIKLGMDTKQVIARFKAEGQALALMDHPNIAKVFEVGATASGRPYMAMELLRGIKIT
jgi:eukaryotic-like serine/threonine-protein kinase